MKTDRMLKSVFMIALFWEMQNDSLVFIHSWFYKNYLEGEGGS